MNTPNPPQDDLFPWEDAQAAPASRPAGKEPALATEADAPEGAPPAAHANAAEPIEDELDDAASEVLDAAERMGLLRERPIAHKEYYSISEVCDLVDLKPHVLRYWETQFQVLNPSKNRSGNRVYQRKEIKLILLVKHLLYEEKYTVEGAKAKLDKLRRAGGLRETTAVALDAEMRTLLREEMQRLLEVLGPADPA
jgi:DNA-binding transcriptional MerR regulator